MRKYILAHPWVLAFAAITGGILQGLMVLTTLITRDIVDAMVAADLTAFYSYIGAAAVIVFLAWVFTLISARMFFAYNFKSKRTLERDFFDSVLATKISDFNQTNSAKYISILNNDIKSIGERYFASMAQFSKDFLSVLLAIAAMAVISPVNALIAVVTAVLPLIAPIAYGKKLARTQMEVSANTIAFNQKVKDYLNGFEVIKTFGVEGSIAPRFFAAATKWMRALYQSGAAVSDVGALTVAIVTGAKFLNYFVAGYFVFTGAVTVGGVVAIVALSMSILQPMTLVANHISNIKSTEEIGKRVLDMMGQRDTKRRPLRMAALENHITFDNVSFAYAAKNDAAAKETAADGTAADGPVHAEKPPALKNMSYTFTKGGKYAVVGASGSGKSTVARLIMGYYDDYKGNITMDGKPVRDIDRNGLYRIISALHQNVFMLDDTLRNNVTLYNPYGDEQYNKALRDANLLGVEAGLTNGSDTVLGEGGNTLSGGERQRISIARALLKGSEVMVLDEATASLDNVVASDIEKSIIGMEGLTCIFVTHRYSTDILEMCDGILVMKDGELCEHGTYRELLERKGHFHGLFNSSWK
jgi:ATP-binding cassette subfamily C protein